MVKNTKPDASITEKRPTRLKRPPLHLLESDSDITDIEDSNINTRPPAKIPTLPSPPRTMEPRRNSSKTPEPSQTCGGLDSLPRAGFCDFCNTPNWDGQSEGHRVMVHQIEEMPGGYRSAVHTTQSMMPQHLAPRMQEWSHEHNSSVDQHQHESACTGLAVSSIAVLVPDSDAASQHTLNGSPVECAKDGWREICSFKSAQEVEPMLRFLGE
ncbi:uncharacterized protein [Sinocyclocheilus grahami]|uniref:uncharacterized protein n=1 Tax=Sinocyclocheilus grahami TaxID=75366 RepID=UPI0007AC7FA4|nr:PREDICTED: uncharacterized protein LOC107574115 [Sinocyclocheilus grahami]